MSISLIMAASKDEGIIGDDGKVPWRLKTDLVRFKTLTQDHVVVMGRKTWESLLPRFRPLPDRGNVVLTKDRTFVAPGALVVNDAEGLIKMIDHVADEVFIIGGATMYTLFLPYASTVYLTEVDAKVAGDTRFAYRELLAPDVWHNVSRERIPADADNEYPSMFRHLTRFRHTPIS
jgi:dihydrofolate reductase